MKRIKTSEVVIYIFMTILAILFLFPMVWMVASATKSEAMIYEQMGSFKSFIPNFTDIEGLINNFKSVFVRYNLWKYMINSLCYAIAIVGGNIIINSMAGYAVAKYRFPGKGLILGLIIGLIVVPVETTIIPLYTIVHNMGLTGTVFAVIVPPLVSVFNIFLFRQFFIGIPSELEEAAVVDGATKLQIYYKVILPLAKPIVATVATLGFIGAWNDYVWPIMVLPAPSGDSWPLYPIQAALNTIQQLPTITTSEVMAALTITTIPLIVIYVCAQQYIVEGFATSGLK